MKRLMAWMVLICSVVANADNYTQTRYPIVLVPGVLGFQQVFGIDYFYGIPQALSSGGAQVFETSASALTSTTARGEELLAQVQNILAITGASKVNLIGHSHGGVSARYVANVLPQAIASVTTIGSPNAGTPVADVLLGVTQIPGVGNLALSISNALASLFDMVAGTSYAENTLGELTSMSTAGQASFNAQFPAGMPATPCGQGAGSSQGQLYYSMSGTSPLTNFFDPTDLLFGITSLAFAGSPNDGLTGQCSSHFGVVLRDDYPWNHCDEINQFMGLIGWFAPDPVSVYREQANRLKNQGV